MKDLYGTEVKIGSKVAFNASGNVLLGEVVGFKNRRKYNHDRLHILVLARGAMVASEVTSPHNLVVLE